MDGCPSDDELGAFVAGELSEPEAQRVAGHVDTCARCRELVALAAAETSASETARQLQPGDRIGRFVVIGLVGKGGMGSVFAAHDPDLDRKVAIKLVRPEAKASNLQTRLQREAQAMARLHHPEVITVYEVGTVYEDVFIAMEFVDGGTLRQWLRETPRAVAEIVERFARAGDGLAAAHTAGLVHRDFKPDNVLVGSDGRQRVTDFGLARASDDEAPFADGVAPDSPLHTSLTIAGTLVGTPAYMAPEQLDGDPVDARADQFSFCVSLYQALYGELPFEGDNARAIRAAIAAERVRPAPRGSKVPARLRAIVLRGLKARPDARFSSMTELVTELRRRARRRLSPALAIGAALLLVVLGGLGQSLWTARRRPCSGAGRELADVWNAARRAQLHATFARSQLPFAQSVWATTALLLDAYGAELTRRSAQVCEATELHHEQPESVRVLRDACLRDRLSEMQDVVDLLAASDAQLVTRAPQVVSSLPAFDPCDDVTQLQDEARSPRTREQGLAAAALRKRLAHVWPAYLAGHLDRACPEIKDVVQQARALDYAPLLSSALYQLGWCEATSGALPEAERVFEESATVAVRAGNDAQAELAWGQLALHAIADAGNLRQAELWSGFADAAEARRRGHDSTTVDLLNTRAQLDSAEGKLVEAAATFARAIQLIDELHINPIARLQYEGNHAITLARQGRLDEAYPVFRHVLDEHRRLLGDDHADTVTAEENMVQLLNLLRRYAEALPPAERGLQQRLASQGPSGADVPDAHHNLSETLSGLGRAKEALVESRAALAILEARLGRDNPALADYRVGEGVALTLLGRVDEAVVTLERALAGHEQRHDSGLDLAPTQLALARALAARGSGAARARALLLAGAARAAYADAAKRYGGNNQARADEIAAFLDTESATGQRGSPPARLR